MKFAFWQPGIAVAVLFLLPATGPAQDNKGKQADVHSDEPGLVHKQMARLAGSWDVEITYIIDDHKNKGTAKCEAKWIMDGRFLQQDYNSSFAGKPFAVLQLLGYDNEKKKTIEIMIDTMSTGLMHNEGSITADGKVITNEGESLDHATGKSTKLRTVTTLIDHDHYTLEWFKPGADGKEAKVVSMLHTRRK